MGTAVSTRAQTLYLCDDKACYDRNPPEGAVSTRAQTPCSCDPCSTSPRSRASLVSTRAQAHHSCDWREEFYVFESPSCLNARAQTLYFCD